MPFVALFMWNFIGEDIIMRIGMNSAESVRRSSEADTGRYTKLRSDTVKADSPNRTASNSSFVQQLFDEAEKKRAQVSDEPAQETLADRGEAAKICEAALKGGGNLISSINTAPKVPYGHLARDGVITYNGVQFVCDEKTNSICLGDMTDKKQVINIPLSGGGHLKVNRANLGQLSKAIGMFSPEDINLILRAIHLDTKVQSMQKEVEDLEASVGEQIADGDSSVDGDGKTEES